jgi:hypothetical protein
MSIMIDFSNKLSNSEGSDPNWTLPKQLAEQSTGCGTNSNNNSKMSASQGTGGATSTNSSNVTSPATALPRVNANLFRLLKKETTSHHQEENTPNKDKMAMFVAHDADKKNVSVSPGPPIVNKGRRGDPRMHKAVAVRLTNPSLSLYHALILGGFKFPKNSSKEGNPNTDGKTSSRKKNQIYDSDNILLSQRKNQLSRRLRLLSRKKKQEEKFNTLYNNQSPVRQQCMLDSAVAMTSAIKHTGLFTNKTGVRHTHPGMPAALNRIPQFQQQQATSMYGVANPTSLSLSSLGSYTSKDRSNLMLSSPLTPARVQSLYNPPQYPPASNNLLMAINNVSMSATNEERNSMYNNLRLEHAVLMRQIENEQMQRRALLAATGLARDKKIGDEVTEEYLRRLTMTRTLSPNSFK